MKNFYENLSVDEIKRLVNRYNKKNDLMVIVLSVVGVILFAGLIIFAVVKCKEKYGCCCCDDDFDYDDDDDYIDDNDFVSDEDFEK